MGQAVSWKYTHMNPQLDFAGPQNAKPPIPSFSITNYRPDPIPIYFTAALMSI